MPIMIVSGGESTSAAGEAGDLAAAGETGAFTPPQPPNTYRKAAKTKNQDLFKKVRLLIFPPGIYGIGKEYLRKDTHMNEATKVKPGKISNLAIMAILIQDEEIVKSKAR